MTDITELAQRARINAECGEHLSPAETMELVEALESEKRICATWRKTAEANSEKLEKAQAENTAGVAGMAESYETTISMLRSRIAELEESHAQVIQSRDHYKRISEEGLKQLAESRTVKLPLPRRKTADDYVDDTFEPCDLAAVYNACRLECEVKFKSALTAAGIKVEAE